MNLFKKHKCNFDDLRGVCWCGTDEWVASGIGINKPPRTSSCHGNYYSKQYHDPVRRARELAEEQKASELFAQKKAEEERKSQEWWEKRQAWLKTPEGQEWLRRPPTSSSSSSSSSPTPGSYHGIGASGFGGGSGCR